MNKVFVTQFSRNLNFAEANEYGSVVFLTDKEFRCEPTMPGVNAEVTHEIKKNFSEYIPGEDYILTTGSAIPNVIVGALLSKWSNSKGTEHNMLKWSNRQKNYELYKVRI